MDDSLFIIKNDIYVGMPLYFNVKRANGWEVIEGRIESIYDNFCIVNIPNLYKVCINFNYDGTFNKYIGQNIKLSDFYSK